MLAKNKVTVIKLDPSDLSNVVLFFEKSFSGRFSKLFPQNEYEFTRYSLANSTVVMYKSGKVVVSGKEIGELEGFFHRYSVLSKGVEKFKYLVGVDETGKGEILGNIVICGVLIDTEVTNLSELEKLVSKIDTKGKKRRFEEYEEVFKKAISLGVQYKICEIGVEELKPKKMNIVMTEKVVKLLEELTSCIDKSVSLRIVIDDFGFKAKDEIRTKYSNAEVIVEHKADDNYLECRVASLISRYYREKFLDYINSSGEYTIEGLSPLNGNLADPKTVEWIRKWKEKRGELPKFVKNWNITKDK